MVSFLFDGWMIHMRLSACRPEGDVANGHEGGEELLGTPKLRRRRPGGPQPQAFVVVMPWRLMPASGG